jgi:hydroxymethylpyrimidine/phosphomethylpyrimidine kinase
MTMVAEVRELLATNPEISVYKYTLLDENMNILGFSEEDQISQLVVNVLQDSCGSGGTVETSTFIRTRIESTSTHGTGCMLSAAVACGLASGLTSDFSPLFTFLETHRRCSAPGAVRSGTIYAFLGILHAFPVGADHFPTRWFRDLCPGTSVCYRDPNVPEPICRPHTGNRYPLTRALISSTASVWKGYVEHTFVKELGKGLLRQEMFRALHQVR